MRFSYFVKFFWKIGMFLILCVFAGVLAFLPGTHSYSCSDGINTNYCYPDDNQEAYCCGINDDHCCYQTNVAYMWWFWVILVMGILFFSICITICGRAQRRRRLGYVVVRGETGVPPTTVVHTHQSGQVAASAAHPQYGAACPAYQGYNQKPDAETACGYPPPYAPPPYAPP